MNQKGFIFTLDAILMLIPIIIVIGVISGVTLESPQVSNYFVAHDAMASIALIDPSEKNLDTISMDINTSNNWKVHSRDVVVINSILNSFHTYNYHLIVNDTTETPSKLKTVTKTTNADIATAKGTISRATRVHNNISFTLYMWR